MARMLVAGTLLNFLLPFHSGAEKQFPPPSNPDLKSFFFLRCWAVRGMRGQGGERRCTVLGLRAGAEQSSAQCIPVWGRSGERGWLEVTQHSAHCNSPGLTMDGAGGCNPPRWARSAH